MWTSLALRALRPFLRSTALRGRCPSPLERFGLIRHFSNAPRDPTHLSEVKQSSKPVPWSEEKVESILVELDETLRQQLRGTHFVPKYMLDEMTKQCIKEITVVASQGGTRDELLERIQRAMADVAGSLAKEDDHLLKIMAPDSPFVSEEVTVPGYEHRGKGTVMTRALVEDEDQGWSILYCYVFEKPKEEDPAPADPTPEQDSVSVQEDPVLYLSYRIEEGLLPSSYLGSRGDLTREDRKKFADWYSQFMECAATGKPAPASPFT